MIQPDANLGPYRLIERIGRGGMGEVWKAEDTRLGRVVAIKVLPAAVSANAEATARLKREARTAAQLYHPNIATIHSIEEEGGVLFIVMEFAEGEPLTKLITAGGIAEADLCRIARGVAEALAEAHAKGIVHRDIKPDNIIVNGRRVKVLDFGIAKQMGVVTTASDSPTAFVTEQGLILGTIHYMSPEQALGKPLDSRTDIFSLGVVVYQAATGRLPFRGETVTETMTQIIRDEPAEPLKVNPGISPGLNAIISRCMRKNREERYASAEELVTALDEQLGAAKTVPYTSRATARVAPAPPTAVTSPQAPPRASALPLIVAAIAIVAAAGLAAVLLRPKRPANVVLPVRPVPGPSAAVTVTAPPSPSPSIVIPTVTESVAQPEPKKSKRPPKPQPIATPPEPTSDDLYSQGLAHLTNGDAGAARETFRRVVEQDPHYAKAHFRLGEIALLNHNFPHAEKELQAALDDSGQLDPHDEALARLGVAIASRKRMVAEAIAHEIRNRWPGDPELQRFLATFGGRRRL